MMHCFAAGVHTARANTARTGGGGDSAGPRTPTTPPPPPQGASGQQLVAKGMNPRSQWAPYPPPPFVLPQRGGRHLLNPKFFVAAHCVAVAKPPPKSAAQSIPVESGEHVQEFKVKWSRTQKIYTWSRSWSRSRSLYIGSPLNVSYSVFFRFMLQFLRLQMCVYGVGDRQLVTVPQGVVGDRLPWGGEGQGGVGVGAQWGTVSAPLARRASFLTRAPPVAF